MQTGTHFSVKIFSCRHCGELTEHWLSRFVRVTVRVWQRVYTCSQCCNDIGVEME